MKKYGFCIPENKNIIEYLPLFLLAVVNIFMYNHTFDVRSACWMIVCAFGEEFLFRGFLLSYFMEKFENSILLNMIVSSLIFAAMHVVNLQNGLPAWYVFIQSLCAGTVGFCFSVVAWKEKSFLHCAVIHAIINVLAIGDIKGEFSPMYIQFCIFGTVAIIYLIYGIILYQKLTKTVEGDKR